MTSDTLMMDEINPSVGDIPITMDDAFPDTTTRAEDEQDMLMMNAFLEEAGDESFVDAITDQAMDTMTGLAKTRQVSESTNETEGPTDSTMPAQQLPVSPSNITYTELPLTITGRPPIQLYLSCNPDHLSPYQCLIRKNVELFEATECDVTSRVKGRNKPIVLGQVGVRCVHCRHLPPSDRDKGNMYFPSSLVGIYQASQILSQQHLMGSCQYVSPELREEFVRLRQEKTLATAGKEYWAMTAQVLGVFEDQFGLRYEKRLGYVRHSTREDFEQL